MPQAASSFAFDVVSRPITYFISSTMDDVNIKDANAKTPSTARFYTIGRVIYWRINSSPEIKKTTVLTSDACLKAVFYDSHIFNFILHFVNVSICMRNENAGDTVYVEGIAAVFHQSLSWQ